ncbi:alpha/beta-hydrolase [Desarmillaria tabescens]|uniref:Alpha/beta-hydrolase n=1 Tax=Armillaria tabescens TaxID=1929756 RepID=A0AA39JF97_ARMTA|nr:alpha/beta-hydrolase [Desarmillaria tabescens]KAK0441533.1 alpha/beta-hydrolase [Desarmillaria tabescens]
MPTATIKSSTGKTNFNYTISTPLSSSAKSIDRSLPTLLFIHAVFHGPQIFQRQFEDPQIRKFNCVALDLRIHGRTTGDALPRGYGAKEAAEDLALFMDEINLPACHVVALSKGSIVAMGLAVYYPDKVASLFLVSPLGLEEPADVADGRREIVKYWKEGFKTGEPDMEVLSDAAYGVLQLGFSNKLDSLSRALAAITMPLALKKVAPANFDQLERATVDFLNNRREYTTEELSRIRVPVKLVHCLGDIAYPQEYTEKFMRQLKDAAVTVSLATIPDAPHFGVVTHGEVVNRLFYEFILDHCGSFVPPAPGEVSSPWEAELVKAGWNKGANDCEDD